MDRLTPSNIIYGKHDYKMLKEQFVLKGIPTSSGIAIGKAITLQPEMLISPNITVPPDEIPKELKRFEKAHSNLLHQFMASLQKVKNESSNIIAIIETNLLILTDPFLNDSVKQTISGGLSVESAIVAEFDKQRNFFRNSNDTLLRERAAEIDSIKHKLLASLKNQSILYSSFKDAIVVAQSLTTTDIVNFKEAGILAIVTEIGGITSHTSILARSFDIPAVIGVHDVADLIASGTEVIVDGFSGIIVVKPKEEIRNLYIKKVSEIEEHKARLGELVKLPAVTTDGKKIELLSNVNFLEEVRTGEINGADGVGLVRSESLVMELNYIPDGESQYNWYKEIAERAYPKPVTIRVFDIGSDKYAEGLPVQEENPALGLRGIRFLLSRTDIFETQLTAILKASANKNVKIMLPMISSLHEVEHTIQILDECKKKLADSGTPFDNNIPVGVMIETPAAAMIADGLAEAADFFSIGTNDLTQYTLAADRLNELVSDTFDSFHPAVLRLIHIAVKAAKAKGIKVSVCGELAGHAAATELLIGLGIDELSVAPSILLELKNRIRNTNLAECEQLAYDILNCPGYEDVRIKLEAAITRHQFIDNGVLINNS